jgi:hypothetical protein
VAVAAGVSEVAQQHICSTQGGQSIRADSAWRQRLQCCRAFKCIWLAPANAWHSLQAEALLPPGRDTVVASQATGAAARLMPGHLETRGMCIVGKQGHNAGPQASVECVLNPHMMVQAATLPEQTHQWSRVHSSAAPLTR